MTLDNVTFELVESNKKLDKIKSYTSDTNEYLLLTVDTLSDKLNELLSVVKDSFSIDSIRPGQDSSATNNSEYALITERLNQANAKLGDIDNEISASTIEFNRGFASLIDFFQGRSLAEIEEKREQKEYQKDLLEAIEGIELTQSEKDVQVAEGFLDSLTRLGVIFGGLALAAGAIAGAFVSFLKNIRAAIKGVGILAKALSPAKLTASITKVFDTIGDFLKIRLGAAGGAFGSAISSITSFFKTIGEFFKASIFKIPGVKGVVDTIGRAVAAAKAIITSTKTITDSVSKIGGFLGAFRNVFGLIFKFVSRIFAPLYTLYETIVGVWKGYQDGGFIGAIKGGIVGFFKGFIGDFLNLIKDAGAWIAGKLGFTEAAKVLSEFDFNVFFENIVNAIFSTAEGVIDFFKKQLGFDSEDGETKTMGEQLKATALGLLTLPFNTAKQAIAEIAGMLGFENVKEGIEDFSITDFYSKIIDKIFETIEDIGDWISELFDFGNIKEKLASLVPSADIGEKFIKEALRSILPKPDESAGFFSVGNIVSSAIPDSVYEYAGINPDTGKSIEATANPKAVGKYQDLTNEEQMLKATQESKEEAKERAMNNNVQTNTVNNVNNNNVTEFRPNPSPVRQPNSPSEMIWNSGASVAP